MKEGKYVNESKTTMTEMIMPNDTNPIGNLMGGNLMRWMDIAGAICAGKHCNANVVTASVDHISFKKPVGKGDIITIEAQVTRAFNTSVEVYLTVYRASIKGTGREKSNNAFLSFVAIDEETGKPIKVPPLIPVTEEEYRLYEGASRRREIRLILSERIKPEEAKEVRDFFGAMRK